MSVSSAKVPVNVLIYRPKLIQGLSLSRYWLEAAANVDGAIAFGGGDVSGRQNTNISTVVDVYNKNYVRTVAPAMSIGRRTHGGAGNGEYMIFGGGQINGGGATGVVDAYTRQFSRTVASALSYGSALGCNAARAGNYVVFTGGNSSGYYHSAGCAYSTGLAVSPVPDLSVISYNQSPTSLSGHAMFGASEIGSMGAGVKVDVYSPSLSKVSVPDLNNAPSRNGAVSSGTHALWGGGYANGAYNQAVVTAYNTSFTKQVAPNLSEGKHGMSNAGCSTHATFAGGVYQTNPVYSTADTYNTNLTKISISNLPMKVCDGIGTYSNDTAMLAGGRESNADYNAAIALSLVALYTKDNEFQSAT